MAAGGFVSLDPRKRLQDLLEALALLPGDVGLVVTGALGPSAADFRARADRLGVTDRVELTNQVQSVHMVELFAGAAAFAFPSAWEGFGLPLVEAMSVGLPCVTSDGGALPEVGGGAATVVPVGQPVALADALGELLRDAGAAERASRLATARAAEFSVARFASAHVKAYDRL